MTHQDILFSPTSTFHYSMMLVWAWLLLERESYWIFGMRESSSQCHNNPVLVPSHKPPDPVKNLYDGHNFDLKTRVDIWMMMDVVPVYLCYLFLLLRFSKGGIMYNGGLLVYLYGLVYRHN